MIHDLKKYKDSKLLVPKLETLLKIITLMEQGVKPYINYPPMFRIWEVLIEEKQTISHAKEYYEQVKKTKGKK